MKNWMTIGVAVFVVVVLLFYMVTFQVAYNEMAVVTTFGAADESSVINAKEEGGGLNWKWPSPIQSVYSYSKGVYFFQSIPEEVTTKDGKAAVLGMYMTWKVTDPLAFFKAIRTTEQAEKLLNDKLRASTGLVKGYELSELTNKDAKKLKLNEVEKVIRDQIQSESAKQKYGVEVVSVGINRLVFSPTVSNEVNETMKSTRQRMAESARSEGEAIAQRIVSDAERASSIILSFANQRAEAIRAEGDAAAAKYYPLYNKNSELAIYLRTLEAYKQIFKEGTTTFVLDSKDSVFDLFRKDAREKRVEAQEAKSDNK